MFIQLKEEGNKTRLRSVTSSLFTQGLRMPQHADCRSNTVNREVVIWRKANIPSRRPFLLGDAVVHKVQLRDGQAFGMFESTIETTDQENDQKQNKDT